MAVNSESRLLGKQTRVRNPFKVCRRCGYIARSNDGVTIEDRLKEHMKYCMNHDYCLETFPSGEKAVLKFRNYAAMLKHPILITFDFESLLEPIDVEKGKRTKQYQKHTPISFGLNVERIDGENKYISYTGRDAAKVFVEKVEEQVHAFYAKFKESVPMRALTPEQQHEFQHATHCWLCNGELDEDRVRDHCHYTGVYRGAAHNKCNLQAKRPTHIPVIAHNLSNYDEKLFFRQLVSEHGFMSIIAKNEENFITLSKDLKVDEYYDFKEGRWFPVRREIRFIDSMRFMSSKLETLVKNMDVNDFHNLRREFPNDRQFELLLRKGVYPYDYMDSEERLNETELPPGLWYNKLNDETLKQEERDHAQKVWDVFGCRTIRDYMEIYQKSDVLQLADVFASFREMALQNYKLDPVHFLTSPSMAWAAALKMTGVELELMTKEKSDMYHMIEAGIRGGISVSIHRHAEANNPYMSTYDATKELSYLIYLDINNLYGGAMCKPLPVDGYEWMSEEELQQWENIPCFLEVDLEYPFDLHEKHNDYPLAAERLDKKLTPNLNDKTNYVIHHVALKNVLKHGLRLKRIHKGIKFNERPWLKPYIEMNTELRTRARNEFEKDFFKLMNNSVFGKTMENVRNRVNISVADRQDIFRRAVKRPWFKTRKILQGDEEEFELGSLALVHGRKLKVTLDKPIAVGATILDVSKTFMNDFHYDYMHSKYAAKDLRLMYTDTDSFVYHIKTADFYKDIAPDVETHFDTSNFPKDHPATKVGLKTGVNKKVVGMMKDECGGKIMTHWTSLRSKLYAYKIDGDKDDHKKAKGVKKCVTKNELKYEHYEETRLEGASKEVKMNIIRSHDHRLYTETIIKTALSANDDKRILMEDNLSTLAKGHWRYLSQAKMYFRGDMRIPRSNTLLGMCHRMLR